MRMMLFMALAMSALLGGYGLPAEETEAVTLEMVVEHIQTKDPETAADTLLRWIEAGGAAQEDALREILDGSGLPAAETACSFAAVLDAAEMVPHGSNEETYLQAVRSLSPLFTDVLHEPSTPFREETPKNPTALTQLQGMWYDAEMQELLVISGETCRVIIPWLGYLGEKAYAVRLRDRSALGYAPALEIDFHDSGTFSGALTYYVSGVDETHFWCNSQGQRFDRLG